MSEEYFTGHSDDCDGKCGGGGFSSNSADYCEQYRPGLGAMPYVESKRLQDALTVALQGLGQLAKSRENRSRSKPSNAQLVRRAEQTLVRVARVLDGHPTYIGEDEHVCLETLPEKRHE